MPKMTKEETDYQKVSSNPFTVCSGCVHFEAPHACEKVAGDILPGGWCKEFKRKGGHAKFRVWAKQPYKGNLR